MSRRSKIWLAVATVFTAINVAGAVFAAVMNEGVGTFMSAALHTLTHVALAVLGGYWMWWLVSRSRPGSVQRVQPGEPRLEYLQQSVDALALEVERIGEAQRFNDKLRSQAGETAPTSEP